MILSRRTFLRKSVWALVGSIAVPYIPKVIYSFPASQPEGGIINPELARAFLLDCNQVDLEQYLITEMSKRLAREWDKEVDLILYGDPAGRKPDGIIRMDIHG